MGVRDLLAEKREPLAAHEGPVSELPVVAAAPGVDLPVAGQRSSVGAGSASAMPVTPRRAAHRLPGAALPRSPGAGLAAGAAVFGRNPCIRVAVAVALASVNTMPCSPRPRRHPSGQRRGVTASRSAAPRCRRRTVEPVAARGSGVRRRHAVMARVGC